MKFKNLVWTISNEDILTLCKLLDKLTINSIKITDNILINGCYKVVGLNVEFEALLSILEVQNNVIYVKVTDFKIAKKDTSNLLVKKSIGLIVNSITSIDGITFNNNIFKIELEKLLNKVCDESKKVKINSLYLDKLTLKNGEIQINLNFVDVILLDLK